MDGKLQVNLVNRWLDDCLRIETKAPIPSDDWVHVGFTYDGTRLASGLRIYVNGRSVELNVIRDEMNQEIKSKEPLRVGRGLGLDYQGTDPSPTRVRSRSDGGGDGSIGRRS